MSRNNKLIVDPTAPCKRTNQKPIWAQMTENCDWQPDLSSYKE